MKTTKLSKAVRSLPFLLVLGLVFTGGPFAQAGKKAGLMSSTSSEVSGTAGVRGGDVMGNALKNAHPSMPPVSRMEQRKVPQAQLTVFQKQGKIGRFAQ